METAAERYVRVALSERSVAELRELREKAVAEFDVHSAALLDKLIAEREG